MNYEKKSPSGNPRNNQNVKCYNCNEYGHFANACENKPFCSYCSKKGHAYRECKSRRFNTNNVRVMCEDELSNVSGAAASIVTDELSDSASNHPHRVCTIQKGTKSKKNSCVDNWVQYVKGEGNKPRAKSYAETLVSNCRSETAKNKPLVRSSLFGRQIKCFFDSGASINIMDHRLFEEICEINPSIYLTKQNKILRCANDSKISTTGSAILPVKLSNNTTIEVEFIVA